MAGKKKNVEFFRVLKQSRISSARLSRITTSHGAISGPFFMPIATRGAVKHLSVDDLEALRAQIVLSNTYHLMLRPGTTLLDRFGGLHEFMNWQKPILTDSGGYQVFSLARHRKITERSATFRDPQSGKQYTLTPEKAVKVQRSIGSDMMMVLDECPPYPASHEYVKKSMILTHRWAERCKREFEKDRRHQHLFGIVQGGVYEDLRKESAATLARLQFDGYAIGGVAVGEPREILPDILSWTVPMLPDSKPRYLMGLGRPEELVMAVQAGVDMFDCVIPTREARHGRLYIRNKGTSITDKNFYSTISMTNKKFYRDVSSINTTSLAQYSKAYLHHLFKTKESLGMRYATIHNLGFYLDLMAEIRTAIKNNEL